MEVWNDSRQVTAVDSRADCAGDSIVECVSKPEVALLYSFCGVESDSVGVYELVSDDDVPAPVRGARSGKLRL